MNLPTLLWNHKLENGVLLAASSPNGQEDRRGRFLADVAMNPVPECRGAAVGGSREIPGCREDPLLYPPEQRPHGPRRRPRPPLGHDARPMYAREPNDGTLFKEPFRAVHIEPADVAARSEPNRFPVKLTDWSERFQAAAVWFCCWIR